MTQSDKSYWLKSGTLSILEKGSVFVFGFGSIYILTRAFSTAEFGVWVLFYTVTSFLEVSRAGLLQNALVKYLSTSGEEDKPIIATNSLLLNALLTGCFVVLLLVSAPLLARLFSAPALTPLLDIYCMTAILLIPMQQFNYIQQANLDFRGIFWSNFTLKGLFFAFVLSLFLLKIPIELITLAKFQLLTAVLASVVSFAFGRRYLQFAWQFSRRWFGRLFKFGLFVFGTNLSTMIYKTIDKLMLGYLAPISKVAMLSTVAVGIYEWAIKITNLVEVPTFSVASVVFPQSARKMQSEGSAAIKALYEKSVGAILAIILPFILFVYFFAEQIIVFLATDKYLATVPVLQVTIWFGLFMPFAVQFGTVLDSIGKPQINFMFTLIGTIINIITNYFFISQFGVIGAAYGTLTAYIILFITTQIVLFRMLGVWAPNVFKYLFQFYRQIGNRSAGYVKNGLLSAKVK